MPASPAGHELHRILDPVSVSEFFRDHWDRKPLCVPGPPHKFEDVYDAAEWAALTGVQDVKAAVAHDDGWQTEIAIDPRQCDALFRAGMTICADVSHDAKVAPFLRRFRRAFAMPGGAGIAKLYASNDGKGFAPHADKFHVFVLQLEGSKRWRVSRTPVLADPAQGFRTARGGGLVWDDGAPALADDGSALQPPGAADMDTLLLEPGHCLYLPPGTWHAAQAVGHSIAVSVSPPRTTQVEFFARLLDVLNARPPWRRDLLALASEAPPPGRLPRSIEDTLDARLADLRTLVGQMDPRTVHRFWRLNVAVGQAALAPPPAPAPITVARTDVRVRRGDDPFHFIVAPAAGGDGIFAYLGAHEWTFPIKALKFLTELSRHQTFTVATALTWDTSLGFEEVRSILADLLEAGALESNRQASAKPR